MPIKTAAIKASQMMSGALGNMVFQLFRNKLLAVALGPVGVGWIALMNNLVETAAVVAGGGVSDSLNRELARKTPVFTNTQLISTAVGISLILLAVAYPAAVAALLFTVPETGILALVIAGLLVAIIGATAWRIISGCFLGLGMARVMATASITAAALNLGLTAALLAIGVKSPLVFAILAPACLIGTGLFFARRILAENLSIAAIRALPARAPVLKIALPVAAGLLLEPMTSFYIRSVTGLRLGEEAIGLLQPGFLFVYVGAALFNTMAGITLVRWDQSHEQAFSRNYRIMLGVALVAPAIAVAGAFVLAPIYPFLISLFFADAFRLGAAAVPWLLAGEVFRMAGAMLLFTFFSREMGYITLLPRIICLITAAVAIEQMPTFTITAAAQSYTAAFAANFLTSLVLWIGFQIHLARKERG